MNVIIASAAPVVAPHLGYAPVGIVLIWLAAMIVLFNPRNSVAGFVFGLSTAIIGVLALCAAVLVP